MEAHYKIFNELHDHMVNISVWVMLEKKKILFCDLANLFPVFFTLYPTVNMII